MQNLVGPIDASLCAITTLRRLCICRCSLSGPIPSEIGNLVKLEELQVSECLWLLGFLDCCDVDLAPL